MKKDCNKTNIICFDFTDGHDLALQGKAVVHAGHRLERAIVPDYATARKAHLIGKNEDVIVSFPFNSVFKKI